MPTNAIHGIHPYPCKFPPSVVQPFLASARVVYDPFCGSGTTLVEAAAAGADVLGTDCNPIATLISTAKLLDLTDIEAVAVELLASRPWRTARGSLPEFNGRDHWFDQQVQDEIASILTVLARYERETPAWTWLAVSLSAIVVRVSRQDGETRYASVDKDLAPGVVLDLFEARAEATLSAIRERGPLPGRARQLSVVDLRDGPAVPAGVADLVVTSPPYANTMDYYLYHKQRMNLLGYDFKWTQNAEIGSRWEFSSLKAAKDKWQADFDRTLSVVLDAVAPGGRAIYVIGDSQIAGELVSAVTIVEKACAEVGAVCQVLDSIALSERSRSFNAKFQRPNKFEHVIEIRRL